MMSYLTRPGKVLANNINNNDSGARTALKSGGSDTKVREENAIERINRINYEFGQTKKRPEHLDNKNIISWEDKQTKKQIKKVADKPKSNGHYKPSTPMDSFDWDLWLRDKPNYTTLEDEDKQSGILEFELADEYWQEQYNQYLNNGGTLDFKNFMQQQNNMKVSKNINKIAEDKKKVEGIASILALNPTSKI